jgi:tryptophan halogenase
MTHAEINTRAGSGDPIRSVVIVGGGTAGWMAATLIAQRLRQQNVSLTLIESSAIGTVGVGEATTPAIRDYFREAALDEGEIVRASGATLKLGIRFDGWAGDASSFFHPFGLYGTPSNDVAFHQYWLKQQAAGSAVPLGAYSLCTALADAGRMMVPPRPAADYAFFDWALHFDAGLYARHLKQVATARGVRHIDAHVAAVRRDPETGFIASVETAEAGSVTGDLFIDCTGFRSLLLGAALDVPYVDWRDWLMSDRAVAIPCAHGRAGEIEPFTRAIARGAGWQWRIPLQHRVGNGYVYSSAHLSDDEAAATLTGTLEGEPLADPNFIRFVTGHRERFWSGNCIALGLAAGFLEPLESTSITLIYSGIQRLLELWPDRGVDPALATDYNRITTLEYERVRDFLMLHYWANRRPGQPLWDAARAMALPDKLAHKIRMFASRGRMVRYEWDAFGDPSWLSMFIGLGLRPERWDPLADFFTNSQIGEALERIRTNIADGVKGAMGHRAFLEQAFGVRFPPAAATART